MTRAGRTTPIAGYDLAHKLAANIAITTYLAFGLDLEGGKGDNMIIVLVIVSSIPCIDRDGALVVFVGFALGPIVFGIARITEAVTCKVIEVIKDWYNERFAYLGLSQYFTVGFRIPSQKVSVPDLALVVGRAHPIPESGCRWVAVRVIGRILAIQS
jgi:hypothetical protein